MRTVAASAGTQHGEPRDLDHMRAQLIAAREILEEGRPPDLPPLVAAQYRQAGRIKGEAADQVGMFDSAVGDAP